MSNDKDYNKLIHTGRWVKLRASKLSANPICERCWNENQIITPATEVHHKHPVEEALTYSEKKRLMFTYSNLQALCHECHVKTHTEMGRSGKAAAVRIRNQQRKEIFKILFGEEDDGDTKAKAKAE